MQILIKIIIKININLSETNEEFFKRNFSFKTIFVFISQIWNLNTLESPKSAIFKSLKFSPHRMFSGFKSLNFYLFSISYFVLHCNVILCYLIFYYCIFDIVSYHYTVFYCIILYQIVLYQIILDCCLLEYCIQFYNIVRIHIIVRI